MNTFTVSNQTALRKKLVEIHDWDGVSFDCEPVLGLIEHISSLVTSGKDGIHNGPTEDILKSLGLTGPNRIPDTLCSMLHKISCELNCKCSGEDMEVTTMEILKLLTNYDWQAKITIILATFAVEYAQFSHVITLYKNSHLGQLVVALKQLSVNFGVVFDEMKSIFSSIIELSIQVTRFIAKFSTLPSKYISHEVESMAAAFNHIPFAVFMIAKVVVACSSHLTQIHTQTEISSYTENSLDLTGFQEQITSIHKIFEEQLRLCHVYIEEKKHTNFITKLKLKLDKTAFYSNNQKILQLLFHTKDCVLPLAFGPEKTKGVGVEILKGKTVLLYISDLDITIEEIFILSKFYQESRNNHDLHYEIMWLPIVEVIEEEEIFEHKFMELQKRMPWHSLLHPKLLKAGVVRFVKEEWHYSKKSIIVALDPRGKVAHPDAFQTLSFWGNAAYPFTQTREIDIWSRKEWSLELLVGTIDQRITKWIKEKKIICLYGGEDEDWLDDFITTARQIQDHLEIKLEMVYIGHHKSEELSGILADRSFFWEAETTDYFWSRIELMGRSENHHGGRVSTTKEAIVSEVLKMKWVVQSKKGWALISHGAGIGAGKIAMGEGDVIFKALTEFGIWGVEAKRKGFVPALNTYLAGHHPIPEINVCRGCSRPM